MTNRRALWVVIGVSTLIRLVFAMSMGGLADEAYYALYARNLDWSYFDHPPMVGVVAAVGEAMAGWINPVVGLRFGFVMMFAGSSWLLARITDRFFGMRAAVLAVLVLNTTVFYGIVVGTLATPDGPLLFFWLLTIDRLAVAIESERGVGAWLGVGLAWGLAMLSKYHAILLPAGAVLYLIVRPSARRLLRTPGPYLATVVGLAVFSPVILWNRAHEWASFRFQGARSGGFRGFRPEFLIEAIVGQAGYLLPWIWLGLVMVLIRLLRSGPRRWSHAEAFLLCQAVPAVFLFLMVATYSQILTHWPLIGFVALMPILGRRLADRLDARPVPIRNWLTAMVAVPILFATLFVAQANLGLFQDSQGRLAGLLAPQYDLSVDTIRWDQIATELKRRGLPDNSNTFMFTCNWRYSAELALALNLDVPVACYHRDARSFSLWSRPEDYIGRDGIYVRVVESEAPTDYYEPWFTRIERLADFPVTRAGFPMQTVRLYRCVGQTSPYGFGSKGPVPIPETRGRIALGR